MAHKEDDELTIDQFLAWVARRNGIESDVETFDEEIIELHRDHGALRSVAHLPAHVVAACRSSRGLQSGSRRR